MSFLNQYNSSGSVFINKVLPINNVIYVVGSVNESNIFLLKLDINGDIIWQKQYTPTNIIKPSHNQIVTCDNDDVIVHTKDFGEPNRAIFRVSGSTGEVMWYKSLSGDVVRGSNNLGDLRRIGNGNYLLSVSGRENYLLCQYLIMLDSNGNIIQKNSVKLDNNTNNLRNNGALWGEKNQLITYDNEYIYVAHNYGFLKLDYNLKVISKLYIDFNISIAGDIKIINGQLFLPLVHSSFNDGTDTISLFTKINFPDSGSPILSFTSLPFPSRVAYADSNYIYITDHESKQISKYDANTKSLILSKTYQTYQNVPEDIHIVNGNVLFGIAGWSPPIVGLLDPDLTSCKTIPNSNPFILNSINLETLTDYNIIENSYFTVPVVNHIVTAQPITLTKFDICEFSEQIPYSNNTLLQSPHLYVQSAGSTGTDSTKGIHLRWMLKNGLANHLPKGNYAIGTANFNKPDDFVKIHRTPYVPLVKTLNLGTTPDVADDSAKRWSYNIGFQLFTVMFTSGTVYNQVRASINPSQNPQNFIAAYCSNGGILEIENTDELSFAVTIRFNTTQAAIKTEYLAVEENIPGAPKFVSLRRETTLSNNNVTYYNENTRAIRLQCTGAYPVSIGFELYADFLNKANNDYAWETVGEYALTLDDTEASNRLEPVAGAVNGKWLRYNDGAYVNVLNYKNKWNGAAVPQDERIKESVRTYIDLSNSANNPTALQEYSYNEVPVDEFGNTEASTFELSNLFVVQTASLDYHVARMMGLGTLDLESKVMSGSYIYVAEYTTFGNLNDGKGVREAHHLYMSLPTSLNNQRLPIPVDLQEPKPGIYTSSQVESPASITGPNGYSHDGKARYFSLFNRDLPEELPNQPFFYKNGQFESAVNTIPVYAGIEYKVRGASSWRKPELNFSGEYLNIDATQSQDFQKSETLSLVIPEPGNPLFVHREKENGWHTYSSYGVNWFSRSARSNISYDMQTVISPTNELLPPTNVTATLIQKEQPLFLTSAVEQQMLSAIQNTDKTLVRLTFDYNHGQELIDYQYKIGDSIVAGYVDPATTPELFAEKIEMFFRNRVPASVSGKVHNVWNDANILKCIIDTRPYTLVSTTQEGDTTGNTAQEIVPVIAPGTQNNYVGSILVIDGNEYIIDAVDINAQYPRFTVWKRDNNGPVTPGTVTIPDGLTGPDTGGLFMAVENMQNTAGWNVNGYTNPLSLKINIDHQIIRTEHIKVYNLEGDEETHVQRFRGIYQNAQISKVLEDDEVTDSQGNTQIVQKYMGLYKISFNTFKLAQHTQYAATNASVQFHNGVVRVHTLNNTQGRRKELKVIRALNIGSTTTPLELYARDLSYPTDSIALATYDGKLMADSATSISNRLLNYYPGYKVYLYQNTASGITEPNILPGADEDVHYSLFGLRSYDTQGNYFSKLSLPALMFARKIEEPQMPEKPMGGKYATRPDFFGKASYTFTTQFAHKPYSVQFSRASDVQIIASLYSTDAGPSGISTYDEVMKNIFQDGQEAFYVDRWKNLLNYKRLPDELPADAEYNNNQFFKTWQGKSLPMPDNPKFKQGINAFIDAHNLHYNASVPQLTGSFNLNTVVIPAVTGQYSQLLLKDFVRETLLGCFVPLTEIPVIYNHVKGNEYTPLPKKQVIRDRNGNRLDPGNPDFDMAPMMKVITSNKTQFTDFGIDGASKAKYFYTAREINLQMKTGPYSEITGPISLVNTSPPTPPVIAKVLPVLESKLLDIQPAVQFEINAYPLVQEIKKITLYRTNDRQKAASIRDMEIVKEIDLEVNNMLNLNTWIFKDDFSDLPFIPYGDLLYYRITVSRQVKYNDSGNNLIIDYAPSEASDVIITNIVNNFSPETPELKYVSEPINTETGLLKEVTLYWEKTVYNGKYHIYKMNSKGNWVKIKQLISNNDIVYLPLNETEVGTNDLQIRDTEGNPVYHHFKIIAENYSGMFSRQEKILTMYNEETWEDIGGIDDMIIGNTFVIR